MNDSCKWILDLSHQFMNDIYRWLIDHSQQLSYTVPLIVAYIVYRLSLKAYYRQKEYELVRLRYLEHTLDSLVGHVEEAISVFRNNWQNSLQYLKQYNDLGTIKHHEPIDKSYIRTQSGSFRISAAYRLGSLLGHDLDFWSMYQLLFVFIDGSTNFFFNDFIPSMRAASDKGGIQPRMTIVERYRSQLEAMNSESYKYYNLLTELQTISSIFEKERLTFKTLKVFSTKKAVRESIARIQAIKNDLASEREHSANKAVEGTAPR